MFVGKSYKRKEDPTGTRYKVIDQQGDFLEFETGERCKTSTLMENFNEDVIDPNAFWSRGTSVIAAAVLNGSVDTPALNDVPGAPPVRRIEAGANAGRPMSEPVVTTTPQYNQKDPYSFPDETSSPPVRPSAKAGADPYAFPDDDDDEYVEKPQPREARVRREPEAPELPEITFFRRMRLATTGVLNLSHEVKMPEKDQAKVLDTMFETSLVDFLAEEYYRQLIQNQDAIKEQFKEQVHTYIYGAKKKSRAKAPVKAPVKPEPAKRRSGTRKKTDEPTNDD